MVFSVSKRSLAISLAGHLAAFSIFSLSFGALLPKADFTAVSFWGAVLGRSQVTAPQPPFQRPGFNLAKSPLRLPDKTPAAPLPIGGYYLKPPITASFAGQKNIPIESLPVLPPSLKKREPMLLFHPALPYGFQLYFSDRQVAHVELSFNIGSGGSRSSIAVKRKISSGNLEVDLLCIRYIGHYLFIEQERFAPDYWQAVKIDLSEND